MGTKNFRGVYVPAPGEDILAGIREQARTAHVITPVTSIAEARQIVTTNKNNVSAVQPMYFDVNGILYKHNGQVFDPMNKVETYVDYGAYGTKLDCSNRHYSILITSSIPRAEYDRSVKAFAYGYGQVLEGRVNLSVEITGVPHMDARFVSGSDGAGNVAAVNVAVIPAGTTPKITMGFRGDNAGRTIIQTASNESLNRLVVEAAPIPMT